MTEHTRSIPDGTSILIPRLFCRNPSAEIEFCTHALGAVTVNRRPGADGALAHALMTIGSAMLMIESEWPQVANRAPAPDGSSPVALYVYVENVDATTDRAIQAGATVLMSPANQFWGDRTAWVMDPSGHVWTIATRIEDTTEQERQARYDQLR
jgi:PhnB protein